MIAEIWAYSIVDQPVSLTVTTTPTCNSWQKRSVRGLLRLCKKNNVRSPNDWDATSKHREKLISLSMWDSGIKAKFSEIIKKPLQH